MLYSSEAIRVALARALYKKAKIILADETTKSRNTNESRTFFVLLKKISKNTLVVVATNNFDLAKAYGYRIIELDEGVIINDQTLNTEST